MTAFRILLGMMIAGIFTYTGIVGVNHGWNLLPVFFSDMAAMTWPGQFNFDFSCFLFLSGLWLSWRNNFSRGGIVLGVFGVVGGIMLLAPYLLWATITANGDVPTVLLGKVRAEILRSSSGDSE